MTPEQKELTNSAIKSVFASIPFVGQPLNELFYDYRGRIKQERLNAFSELLKEHFNKHEPVDFTQLNHVEFSDLFESVILSVVKTGSKEKHRRFKNILINYIDNPGIDIDYTETYLELINNLNENAIKILHFHNKHHEELLKNRDEHKNVSSLIHKKELMINEEKVLQNQGSANNVTTLTEEFEALSEQKKLIEQKSKSLEVFQHHTFYNITENEYLYLKQVLSAKGLMTDIAVGTFGHIPFQTMRMTQFGIEFISFIASEF